MILFKITAYHSDAYYPYPLFSSDEHIHNAFEDLKQGNYPKLLPKPHPQNVQHRNDPTYLKAIKEDNVDKFLKAWKSLPETALTHLAADLVRYQAITIFCRIWKQLNIAILNSSVEIENPLLVAIHSKNSIFIQLLILTQDKDQMEEDEQTRHTAVQAAYQHKDYALLDILLCNEYTSNIRCQSLVLAKAIQDQDEQAVALLIKYNASWWVEGNYPFETLFDTAIASGNFNLVRPFLVHHAKILQEQYPSLSWDPNQSPQTFFESVNRSIPKLKKIISSQDGLTLPTYVFLNHDGTTSENTFSVPECVAKLKSLLHVQAKEPFFSPKKHLNTSKLTKFSEQQISRFLEILDTISTYLHPTGTTYPPPHEHKRHTSLPRLLENLETHLPTQLKETFQQFPYFELAYHDNETTTPIPTRRHGQLPQETLSDIFSWLSQEVQKLGFSKGLVIFHKTKLTPTLWQKAAQKGYFPIYSPADEISLQQGSISQALLLIALSKHAKVAKLLKSTEPDSITLPQFVQMAQQVTSLNKPLWTELFPLFKEWNGHPQTYLHAPQGLTSHLLLEQTSLYPTLCAMTRFLYSFGQQQFRTTLQLHTQEATYLIHKRGPSHFFHATKEHTTETPKIDVTTENLPLALRTQGQSEALLFFK